MKKMKLMSVVMTLLICLGFNLASAQTVNSFNRVTNNTPASMNLILTTSSFYPTSSMKTFNNGSTHVFGVEFEKIQVTFENGSLYSTGTYYLPTAINGTTNITLDNEPKLSNYQGRYGYAVSIKKIGSRQYTIKVTKLNMPN